MESDATVDNRGSVYGKQVVLVRGRWWEGVIVWVWCKIGKGQKIVWVWCKIGKGQKIVVEY